MKDTLKFSSEMLEAIVNGNKTQTRRPLYLDKSIEYSPGNFLSNNGQYIHREFDFAIICKYGRPGDIINCTDGKNIVLVKIISLRIENLIYISTSDIEAEGVKKIGKQYKNYLIPAVPLTMPKNSFRSLWQSFYENSPAYSWYANPWVWVIEFERVQP